jgi:hypothetical protein
MEKVADARKNSEKKRNPFPDPRKSWAWNKKEGRREEKAFKMRLGYLLFFFFLPSETIHMSTGLFQT